MTATARVRMSAEERREMVLEAAVAEFALHGLAGTSTEDVARTAGISQPYLFRLFPTKKGLFLALVERCYLRIEEAFIAAAGDKTGEAALEAMGDEYERLLENRTLLLLQMHAYAASDDPRRLQAAVDHGGAGVRAALRPGRPVLRHGHADERGGGHGPARRR